jgi:uncharacterized protein (TIGR02266 family)
MERKKNMECVGSDCLLESNETFLWQGNPDFLEMDHDLYSDEKSAMHSPPPVRAAPRINARLRVSYGFRNRQLLADYTVNLSTGGLFLETEDPLPQGTPLELEFLLPEPERKIRCQGQVAWQNPPGKSLKEDLPSGIGVQFTDLGLDDMDALREFVRTRMVASSW